MNVTASERHTALAHAQDAYIVGDGFPCFCATCQKVRRHEARVRVEMLEKALYEVERIALAAEGVNADDALERIANLAGAARLARSANSHSAPESRAPEREDVPPQERPRS